MDRLIDVNERSIVYRYDKLLYIFRLDELFGSCQLCSSAVRSRVELDKSARSTRVSKIRLQIGSIRSIISSRPGPLRIAIDHGSSNLRQGL
jgi:hypothetical protein